MSLASLELVTMSSPSVNSSSTGHDPRDEHLALVEVFIQGLIFVLAVTGNVFILYALWRQRQLRPWSRVYLLMAHLSFADLLVALFNILPQLAWDITFRFRGGDSLCRIVKYLQIFVLYLSTYVLLAMSIDRYLAVARPGVWGSARLARQLVAGAWILSTLFAMPQLMIFRLHELRPGVQDCWVTFSTTWAQRAYVTWFSASVFLVPLIVIAFCYGAICLKLWRYKPSVASRSMTARFGLAAGTKNGSVRFEECEMSSTTQDQNASRHNSVGDFERLEQPQLVPRVASSLSAAKLKTIKLTLTVVVCFIVCWSPFCVTQLWLAFSSGKWRSCSVVVRPQIQFPLAVIKCARSNLGT